MNRLLPRTLLHLYQQHPALLLTLGYLLLTAVGMSYEFLFCKEFKLNIFDYADASDFVLVALRKPRLLLFTIISMAIIRNTYRLHDWSMRRSGRYRALTEKMMSWRAYGALERILIALSLMTYFGFFSALYAHYNADRIKAGQGHAVLVELVSEVAAGSTNRVPTRYLPLASTSRYFIVFNPANGQTAVLPVNNISRLTLDVALPKPSGRASSAGR